MQIPALLYLGKNPYSKNSGDGLSGGRQFAAENSALHHPRWRFQSMPRIRATRCFS
jgi:hypothetical protein